MLQRLWQITALLLLALMVPASVCCQLYEACAAQECSTCHCPLAGHQGGDNHPLPPACPRDSIAHSQLPDPVTMPDRQMVEILDFLIEPPQDLDDQAMAKSALALSMTAGPPELRTAWTFAIRAALPARAPSARA